jgi:hypothetical protein
MILARFGGGPRAGTAAPAASPTAAPAGAGRWSERLPTAWRHCATSAAPAAAPPACQSASQRGRCCSTSTTASHRPGAWNPPAVVLVLASRTAATAARAGDWMKTRRSSPRLSMVRRRGRGRVSWAWGAVALPWRMRCWRGCRRRLCGCCAAIVGVLRPALVGCLTAPARQPRPPRTYRRLDLDLILPLHDSLSCGS